MSEFIHDSPNFSESTQEPDFSVADLAIDSLARFTKENPESESDQKNIKLIEIPLPQSIAERYSFLSELPPNVAAMGGVARSIAREMITGEREPIRDIDLVNIVDKDGSGMLDYDTADKLSREYMPDDYTFGHGIKSETIDGYFNSRDFTINQCLVKEGKLIISDSAYNDFQENIIRPTEFVRYPEDDNRVNDKIFLKAIMLRGVVSQFSKAIPTIEDMERPDYISSFNIALFLNKAMSRGAKTARVFTGDLVDWDIIDEEYRERPVALAKALLDDVYSFVFRPSADKRFVDIAGCEDMDGFFVPPAMSKYHASDPTISRAIAEYEDDFDGASDGDERLSGHYTQAEYDEINNCGNYDEYDDDDDYGESDDYDDDDYDDDYDDYDYDNRDNYDDNDHDDLNDEE